VSEAEELSNSMDASFCVKALQRVPYHFSLAEASDSDVIRVQKDLQMKLDLNGEWEFHDAGRPDQRLRGTVPGCVHTDLLAAGKIPDPWYRDQEKDIQWVHRRDWIYERSFEVGSAILDKASVRLVCEGLDTLCKVYLNENVILEADNMHRAWEVEIKEHLRMGENELRLHFASPIPLMEERTRERRLPSWNTYSEEFAGKSYVRKMACAFGWDWGLRAPTAGIWRPIRIEATDARIKDVHVRQSHAPGRVTLDCLADFEGEGSLCYRLDYEGVRIAEAAQAGERASLIVDQPRLWWPNGMGEQHLYTLTVSLKGSSGEVQDIWSRRLGLRTCELVREPDMHGESFRFRINGRDTFIKGGNWIPCDVFPSRVSTETYRHQLGSCRDAHMNMIRVWGGGIYEDDRFYDLCDEMGLLVWQDFMFACATYPTFDDAFMASVREEARDNVKRLRPHACIALWCGNNELEQGLVNWETDEWTEGAMPSDLYLKLFDDLLPEVVAEMDPDRTYWPCSGHTPGENRLDSGDATAGDAHSWSVWFGGRPIEAQRDWRFRFMSEFGFQSYPELKTVETYTAPGDRHLINWVMDYHQRSGPGNQTILKYCLDWFRTSGDFGNSLIVSQLIQALCIQVAAEHARRIQGRMDGLLYWQINDLWPGATWSSIDVYGRWKALHHLARRAFSPILVSLLEDHGSGTVAVHVSNHRPETFEGTLRWMVTDAAGVVLNQASMSIEIASQSNVEVYRINCAKERERGGTSLLPLGIDPLPAIPMEGDRDLLVWAVIGDDKGAEVSRNLAFFARPKYWKLKNPDISCAVRDGGDAWVMDLHACNSAPWTRIHFPNSETIPSDNFFHLHPDLPVQVRIDKKAFASAELLIEEVRIQPFIQLFDGGYTEG